MATSLTTDEVNKHLLDHLIEAAALKSEIVNMKSAQAELTTRLLTQMGEIAGDVRAIRTDIGLVPDKISECRNEMRREVERDFPSRIDHISMEKRIEKKIEDGDRELSKNIQEGDRELSRQIASIDSAVKGLWIKISTAIMVVAVVVGIAVWMLENVSAGVLK